MYFYLRHKLFIITSNITVIYFVSYYFKKVHIIVKLLDYQNYIKLVILIIYFIFKKSRN